MIKKIPGEIYLLLTAVIWGYGFVAVANSLEQFSPFQLLFFRFSIASLFLIVVFHKRVPRLKKQTMKKGALLGIAYFSGFALQTVGMVYTTASKSAFLTGLNVVIVPIISYFLFKRKLTKQEAVGAVLALVGMGILTVRLDGQVNIGDLLTIGCAVAFAAQIFFTTLFMEGENPIDITITQIISCTVISGVAALFEGAPISMPNQNGLFSILYLALFSTAITTVMQSFGQKYTSETRSAILLSTESLWGTFFAVIFLGDALTGKIILGGLIIFGAILLSEIKPKKKPGIVPAQTIGPTPVYPALGDLLIPESLPVEPLPKDQL
ncbi:MAG: DMT family transporter [Clostridiaceae bacterium]